MIFWRRRAKIPAIYREAVDPLIATARVFLEDGRSLDPVAVVGNTSTNQGITVPIALADDASNDRTTDAIRAAARDIKADFILTIVEAWGLPKEMVHQLKEIRDRYGSIAASPHKIDAVSFTLELRQGIWAAQLPIVPKDPANKTRTFSEVTLEFVDGAQGLDRLLPMSKSR